MCIMYDVRKGVALLQEEKWANSHNGTQLLLEIIQYFLTQTVLGRNMKNIHCILEKNAECEPYEFPKVNTIALIWQLLSSTFITKFWNMFEHHVLVLHEK